MRDAMNMISPRDMYRRWPVFNEMENRCARDAGGAPAGTMPVPGCCGSGGGGLAGSGGMAPAGSGGATPTGSGGDGRGAVPVTGGAACAAGCMPTAADGTSLLNFTGACAGMPGGIPPAETAVG